MPLASRAQCALLPTPRYCARALPQVAQGGDTFTLDGDLTRYIGLLATFQGTSRWLSPGHLSYHVRRVRLELRAPRGLAQRLKAWKVKAELEPPPEVSELCRPDEDAPALFLPLPFPPNELFVFAVSRCGGLCWWAAEALTGTAQRAVCAPCPQGQRGGVRAQQAGGAHPAAQQVAAGGQWGRLPMTNGLVNWAQQSMVSELVV